MADSTIAVGAITQLVVTRPDITASAAGTAYVVPYSVPRKGVVTTALAAVSAPTTSSPIEMVAYTKALLSVVVGGTSPVATIAVNCSPLVGGTYLLGVDSNCLRVVTASTEYLIENVNNYIEVSLTAITGTSATVTVYVTPLV